MIFIIIVLGLRLRPVRAPHEGTIATGVPRIGAVDFQRFVNENTGKWVTSGETLYRAGDKRVTCGESETQ
ncbi:MAG: hypothetical protein QOD03_1070 [Verrucomicrobiota bacterium]|jgi:hypothetical protein